MAETAKLPTAAPDLAHFFGEVANYPEGVLSGAHNDSVATLTLTANIDADWPTAGAVTIDSEIIEYTGKSGATLTGCTRGAQGTTAAAHADAAVVGPYLTARTVNRIIAEIIQMAKTGAGAKGADVASATALDIGTDGHYFHVTGATAITSIETRLAGQVIALEFDGALTLTHNATSLILRGGVNVTTVAGDVFTFVSEGSGNWREIARLTSASIGGGATDSLSGVAAMVRKTSDETVNNSSTLQDDDELLYALAANEVWRFQFFLLFSSGTTPDLKVAATVPAGATAFWRIFGISAADAFDDTTVAVTTARGIQGSSATRIQVIDGYVANGATPGNLQLQWAQNTANASDTKVLTNSHLMLWRLA